MGMSKEEFRERMLREQRNRKIREARRHEAEADCYIKGRNARIQTYRIKKGGR